MTTFLTTYRKAQNPGQTHFCPGCGHGHILKLVDEAICERHLEQKTIWVSPVGCGGLTDSYLSVSHILSAHGRASAVATAVKRLYPDSLVIVSQGDGDLASIGLLEAIHAANRGENITVFFINNANFGMTGGQMAPTSLVGQCTTTSPHGRTLGDHGAPLKICEILNQLEGPALIARVALGEFAQLSQARKIFHKAIENQCLGRGYSFVEVLSPCPSNWHCSPAEASRRVAEDMIKTYPLGIFRDESREDWIKSRPQVTSYLPDLVWEPFIHLAQPMEISHEPIIEWPDKLSICCAGFGGQGVLTLGRFLSQIALLSGLNATWIPSYGPEMRGGVANCFVRVSSTVIDSPVSDKPDVVIAMNQPSFDKFIHLLPASGMMIYDSDVIQTKHLSGVHCIGLPATSLAASCGAPKSVNIVLLGAFMTQFLKLSRTEHLCRELANSLNESQMKALQSGMACCGSDLLKR